MITGSFILLTGLFISYCHGAEKCFECQNTPYPRDCGKVALCGIDEYCYVEQFVTTSGTILYNSGCMAKARCDNMAAPPSSAISDDPATRADRSTDIVTCVHCCADELCNTQGCGTTDVPRDQRGPYCYTCDTTLDPSLCNSVSMCAKNEICLLYSPLEFAGHPEAIYTGMCETTKACTTLANAFQGSRCVPSCCSDDFCNTKCGTRNTSITHSTPVPASTVQYTTTQLSGSTDVKTTIPPATTNPALASTIVSSCKPGYYYDDLSQMCIRIVEGSFLDYDSARRNCEAQGEQLVVVDTHEKMVFVENMLLRHSALDIGIQYFWIGLTKTSGDTFRWVNGQDLVYTYWGGHDEVFAAQQPDNNINENCVLIVGQDHYMWHDEVCANTRPYICEVPSGPVTPAGTVQVVTSTASHGCDTSGGYSRLSSGDTHLCVKVHTDQQNWDNARSTCQTENGDLVILENMAKALLMKQYVQDQHEHGSFWIGAKDFDDSNTYKWVDMSNVVLSNGDWQPGQPNHYDAHHVQDCANLWSPDGFRWHDDRCDKILGFICERK